MHADRQVGTEQLCPEGILPASGDERKLGAVRQKLRTRMMIFHSYVPGRQVMKPRLKSVSAAMSGVC